MRMLWKLIVPVLIFAVLMAVGWYVLSDRSVESEPTARLELESSTEDRTVIDLSDTTLRESEIQTVRVVEQNLQPTQTLVGRLDYNADRHVAIRTTVAGVLTELRVRPGDAVVAGQVVAVITSPEVGRVRSEMRQCEAELELAKQQYAWHAATCDGVKALVRMIREHQSPETIETALRSQSLGTYRELLVSAYSRLRLARQMTSNVQSSVDSGALAGRVQQQRESELVSASSALDAVAEQSLFETDQACRKAQLELDSAERKLAVSQQQLQALLGTNPNNSAKNLAATQTDDLSHVAVVSPIDGYVEDRMFSATERVQIADTLIVVADTSQLWAIADVREHDWNRLRVKPGDPVALRSPAIPGVTYQGKVLYLGRRVDPTTGAGSLVAELDAQNTRLRPGLFIHLDVPVDTAHTAVVVPESAVVTHENQTFVFIVESEKRFRRVNVTTSSNTAGLIEITSGLSVGTSVVAQGAFLLKSELLLASEQE